jgi:8-oxo-dGTP pyrophosphatase MutT (NUDIX family)
VAGQGPATSSIVSAPGEPPPAAPVLEVGPARVRDRLAGRRRRSGAPASHPGRPAAVLVLLVTRPEGLGVVFTLRPAALAAHAGQISLPGGKRTSRDADAAACALREAAEELGLDAAAVEVLGLLDDEITPTGYLVTPVVGLVPHPPTYRPDPGEVAEVFEVPFAVLADPTTVRDMGAIGHGGIDYRLFEYHVGARVIWGVTARIVRQLLALWPEAAAAGA